MGLLIGVDEVGRGCLAGPLLVVAARVVGELPSGLRDSKLMTKYQRETIYHLLTANCQFGEGWVKPSEIDRYGLAKSMRLATARALQNIEAQTPDRIIIDGKVNYLPNKFTNSRSLIKADAMVPIVSAASIYAKVTRDRYMTKLSYKYPAYNFDSHVGYGTKTHMLAIRKYGALKYIHRFSYSPITELYGVLSSKPQSVDYEPSTL